MYRMVKVSPDDFHYQRLLWRKSPAEPIEDYAMRVLMFGLKPAPWLATRTTYELAQREKTSYPHASKIIQEDLYLDDLISGGSTPEKVFELRQQVQDMMQSGGFTMRKWVSTNETVMSSIPESLKGSFHFLEISEDKTVKTLGIQWSPTFDQFTFTVCPSKPMTFPTKRFILSETSKIFDPLGWLAPVIIKSKILIQCLWSERLEWDKRIPEKYKEEWISLSSDFAQLKQVTIPRCVILQDFEALELHGFSDASEAAYGAVVYLKSTRSTESLVRLIAAKTRLAPLSPPQSIPKLELCGAFLLAHLMEMVKKALKIPLLCYAYTDSTTVLHWLRCQPTRWKTFIANRIGEIQSLIP
ncbi:unnamed protein product [Allacma fusca]|uniref:Uncharacterized protein n=1 Tax=Allacma fusca TaxID=39272 RepID=A0A8J2PBX2_9HEXA|nr:unnamed protein product [Allacma fusca]